MRKGEEEEVNAPGNLNVTTIKQIIQKSSGDPLTTSCGHSPQELGKVVKVKRSPNGLLFNHHSPQLTNHTNSLSRFLTNKVFFLVSIRLAIAHFGQALPPPLVIIRLYAFVHS